MKQSFDHDREWQSRKTSSPSALAFTAKVRELEATGLQFDSAWSEARRRFPSLHSAMNAVNEGNLPRGAELSSDGQRLVGDWPVPPSVLGALGLPMNATREEFEIFKAASKVTELEPQVAAKVIVLLIQFSQVFGGVKFAAVMAEVKKRFPELHSAVNKVSAGS